MSVNRDEIELPILVDDQSVKSVNTFTYLGSTVSFDASLKCELNNRIGRAAGAIKGLIPVSRNRLTISRKYCSLIGYRTHYLSGDR